MLQKLDCDPILGMAKIALGDVPCPVCKGEGSVRWPGSELSQRCDACQGTGRDAVPIELRARMMVELAQYVASKRKAVDHDGASNDQLIVEIVRFGDG
jgi:DnaJ-class molecular chaperone